MKVKCLAQEQNTMSPARARTRIIGVRAGVGGGGRGGLQPPQSQKFLKFFGQNADYSGKSTREKTLSKVVKARLEGYFLRYLPCQDGVKVK